VTSRCCESSERLISAVNHFHLAEIINQKNCKLVPSLRSASVAELPYQTDIPGSKNLQIEFYFSSLRADF